MKVFFNALYSSIRFCWVFVVCWNHFERRVFHSLRVFDISAALSVENLAIRRSKMDG